MAKTVKTIEEKTPQTEEVKEIIVNTATEKVSTYGLLNADAAVGEAYKRFSNDEYEESDDGLLIGNVKNAKNKEFKNATITVYNYDEANANIPVSEGKINGVIGDFVCSTISNEYGDYVLGLDSNNAYYVTYTAENYQSVQAIVYINNKNVEVSKDVIMKRLNVIDTEFEDKNNEKVEGASVEITVTDNLIEGEYTTKDEDGSYVYTLTSNDTEFVSGSSDENGMFSAKLDDGLYRISVNKEGYTPTTIEVEAKNENVYDENGEILEKITLVPIEASIYGKVTVRNMTTNVVTPKSGHTVVIMKDGEAFASVTTQEDGTYRALLNEYGNYTVAFSDEDTVDVAASTNFDYEVNFEFETEDKNKDEDDDEDPDTGDGDSGNGDSEGDNNEPDPDFWKPIGEDGVTIEFTGDGNADYSNGENVTSFHQGLWLKTSNGVNDYYIKLYTTPETGEFTQPFGSQSGGLYTTTYHYWTHKLVMDIYDSQGNKITSRIFDYFFERTNIYFESTNTTPLMKVDAITSVTINTDKISYNMHTDGYYKPKYNSFGTLTVVQEDWSDDVINSVSFYNNSVPVGTSAVSPFATIE